MTTRVHLTALSILALVLCWGVSADAQYSVGPDPQYVTGQDPIRAEIDGASQDENGYYLLDCGTEYTVEFWYYDESTGESIKEVQDDDTWYDPHSVDDRLKGEVKLDGGVIGTDTALYAQPKITMSMCGTEELSWTLEDKADYFDDDRDGGWTGSGDIGGTISVRVIPQGSMTVDGSSCIWSDESGTFTASLSDTSCGGYSCIEWTAEGGTPSGQSGGSTFTVTWGSAGTHKVKATYGTTVVEKSTEVKAVPSCDDDPCSRNDSGGGCGSGGCGGGGGFPTPSICCVAVQGEVGVPGPRPPDGGSFGEPDDCPMYGVKEHSCGGKVIAICYICMKCYVADFRSSSSAYVGDGWTVTRNQDGSYLAQHLSGAEIELSSGGSVDAVFDPGGNEPIDFVRDGNGHLVGMTPRGDGAWGYTHDLGDERITKVTAPDNSTVEIGYVLAGQNGEGQPETITHKNSSGVTVSTETRDYNAEGALTSVTKDGRTMTYAYTTGPQGEGIITVTETTASPQIVTEYDYGSSSSCTTAVTRSDGSGPPEQVTVYTYTDENKRKLYSVTNVGYGTTTYTYYDDPLDPAGLEDSIKTVTDPLSNVTTYTYCDPTAAGMNGQVLQETVTLPEVDGKQYYTKYTYVTDNNGTTYPYVETIEKHEVDLQANPPTDTVYAVTKYTYNTDWTVQQVEDGPDAGSLSVVSGYTYYQGGLMNGLLEQESVPNVGGGNKITEYYYLDLADSNKLHSSPTKVSYEWWNPDPQVQDYETKWTEYTYDAMGRQTKVKDALGNETGTAYTYDGTNSVVTVTHPDTTTQVTESGPSGVIEETDENGNKTHYEYAGGRLTMMWTDVNGQSSNAPLVAYQYDEFGNTAAATTYKDSSTGRTTSYTYDGMNRVVQIDHPGDLEDEYFQYDDAGNLIGKKDGNGKVTAYSYDELGRVVETDYEYANNAVWPVDPSQTPLSPDVTYAYHRDTRLVETMVDSTGTSSYAYDHRGRMVSYTPPVPANYGTITYTYDNANNKTSMTLPGNLPVNYAYYRNGWLRWLTESMASGFYVNYWYDEAGNRTAVLRNGTSNRSDYTYDERNRLESITHEVGQTTLASVAYTRDGVGSPTQAEWVNGTAWKRTYGYDAMNRLTRETHIVNQQTQWENTWNYDWVGNRLDTGFVYDEDTDWLSEGPQDVERLYTGAGSMYDKDGTGYTYNAQELLSGVGSTTMAWDAESRRVSLTVGNDAYTFVYDPTASIPAVVQEFGPEGRNIVYVREPEGSLAARAYPDEWTGEIYYFDALGSTVVMTDMSMNFNVTDRYAYDAWGEVDHLSGSTADNPYLYVGELGYYDHWQAPALADMLHLGVRFYEPGVGRFTGVDPLREGLHWLSYVGGSPLLYVDPTGLSKRRFCEINKIKGTRTCRYYSLKSGNLLRTEKKTVDEEWANTCKGALKLELVLDLHFDFSLRFGDGWAFWSIAPTVIGFKIPKLPDWLVTFPFPWDGGTPIGERKECTAKGYVSAKSFRACFP